MNDDEQDRWGRRVNQGKGNMDKYNLIIIYHSEGVAGEMKRCEPRERTAPEAGVLN